MARGYYINGQCLVSYDGSELGLTDGQGKVTMVPNLSYLPIQVDGWFDHPPERQVTLFDVTVTMTLVHFDLDVFNTALANSQQTGGNPGVLAQGGKLLGANNGYRQLLLSSPIANNSYLFNSAYIRDQYNFPIGAERSLLQVSWHCVGYVADPYNSGVWSQGVTVYS